MDDQPKGESVSDLNSDVFTQSPTDFPGTWAEEDISTLLNAWEEAVDAQTIQSQGKPSDMVDKILEVLTENGFRHVEREEVVKQMGALRKYSTYLRLVKAGIPTVKGADVTQLQRLVRKAATRRGRRRRNSTASNQMDGASEDDGANHSEVQSQPENTEETTTRTKRVRFQRQTLQRSIRTMIAQQRVVMDYLQNIFDKIDESNGKMISLLGELVNLQKYPNYTELN